MPSHLPVVEEDTEVPWMNTEDVITQDSVLTRQMMLNKRSAR